MANWHNFDHKRRLQGSFTIPLYYSTIPLSFPPSIPPFFFLFHIHGVLSIALSLYWTLALQI
jgi:hypothetical protein